MEKKGIVPESLVRAWEEDFVSQRLPYTEFRSFMRMKENDYWESLESVKESQESIFTNSARNKLTAYGQKVALERILEIPEVERTCRFARIDFEEMQKRISDGFATVEQKEMFESMRTLWFAHLKERMCDLRISKEVLSSYGIDWKVYKTFAFAQI